MAEEKKVKKKTKVVLDDIRKQLKSELISLDENYTYFLTGNPMLDAFVGSGGLPKNQLEYIWASTSVGKSTLALQILASYLKQAIKGKFIVLLLDTEESVTPQRLRALGVDDLDLINILNPDSIERVDQIIAGLMAKYTNIEIFVIWDTLATTPAAEELDGYNKIGMQARAYTAFFRKRKFFEQKLTMFALNQYRESMDGNAKYMPKEPPGGNAVKHKSFVTLYGSRKNSELTDKQFGYIAKLETVKSKIISPKRVMEFEFTHTGGYDSVLTLINYVRSKKLMGKKQGGWYYFNDDEEQTWRLNDLYKWLLTDEAVPKWLMVIDDVFDTLYPDDDPALIVPAKKRIKDYYFPKGKFKIDRLTSTTKRMLLDDQDSISSEKDLDGVMDTIDKIIDTDEPEDGK